MKNITIYADGACRGNQHEINIGGWGCLLIFGEHQKELFGGEKNTTNNKMELLSAIKAFQELNQPCQVDFYSDSNYVIKGMSEWINGWLKKNWVNAKREPIKNKELWLELLEASKPHKVKWNWVKGHANDELNQRADELANFGCDSILGE